MVYRSFTFADLSGMRRLLSLTGRLTTRMLLLMTGRLAAKRTSMTMGHLDGGPFSVQCNDHAWVLMGFQVIFRS